MRQVRAHRPEPIAPAAGPSPRGEAERWGALLAQARLAASRVLRLPPDHPDVEDRAQDALVAYLSAGQARFDARLGTLEGYLATIARNLSLSHLRDRGTRRRLEGRLAEERSGASDGEGSRRQIEARADLGQVFLRLCPGHAEALQRIDLWGEPIGEAARRLGKSYQAMNGQVGHARAAARKVARELQAA